MDASKSTAKSLTSKAKAVDSPASEEPPSSETRRSGRERRPWNPDVVFGARPLGSSPQQSRTPPSDPKPRPSKGKEPAQEPPGSTPRRSGRERRTWDPDRVFGSRLSDEHQDETTAVAEIPRPKGRENVVPDGSAVTTVRKPKPAIEETAGAKRRRGRPSLDRNDSPAEGSSRPMKRKQKTTEAAEPSTADRSKETAQPRRRGRPRASDAAQDARPSQTSGSRARRRNSSPQPDREPAQEPASAKRKRKAPQPRQVEAEISEETGSESEEGEDLPFRHLRETIRNVPRSTISAKWSSLDALSVNAVTAFIVDAQRPVLLRLQDTDRRREYASSALAQVSRRLHTRLTKGFPFPAPTVGVPTRANAGSHEDEFDFERTVDALQAMENTLNPLLHSVRLLQKEIRKEEDALARDYEHLHKLESNARSKAKEWRDRAKREHALAPGVKRKGDGDDQESRDVLELVSGAEDAVLGGLFKVCSQWPCLAHLPPTHGLTASRTCKTKSLSCSQSKLGATWRA